MNRGMTLKAISWLLPEKIETNEDLVREFGAWTPNKIYSKTGVNQRHIAEGAPLSDFLAQAGEKFFAEHPHISRDSIDMLIVCTETRDYILPATACIVHDRLGLKKTCGAFDYDLGCSGYVYGLAIARGFICGGLASRVLLMTGDLVTRYINEQDKATRTIFGDGFTATLLEASEADRVAAFDLCTDGSGSHMLIIEAGASAMPYSPQTSALEINRFGNVRCKENLFMDGPNVLEFALAEEPGSIARVLEKAGCTMDDMDLVVFHQATKLMLDRLREHLGIPEEKFVIALEDKGNTVSSTIPIALGECAASGCLKPGMKVLISGFGVGLSWGAAVIEWN